MNALTPGTVLTSKTNPNDTPTVEAIDYTQDGTVYVSYSADRESAYPNQGRAASLRDLASEYTW